MCSTCTCGHVHVRFMVLFVVKRSTSFYSVGTFFGSFWRRQKDLPLSLLLVRFLVLLSLAKRSITIVLCYVHVHYMYDINYIFVGEILTID